nr:MAG TPA: hypothetical protein [Caudoviricetes sp.]
MQHLFFINISNNTEEEPIKVSLLMEGGREQYAGERQQDKAGIREKDKKTIKV